jgi:serine/threonine-protein kinase HipA
VIRLRLWAGDAPMGWFGHAAGEYFFEYDPQWLAQPGAFALSPHFVPGSQRFTGVAVRNHFENLLPEGQALDDVIAALAMRDASVLDLLGRLGRELAGALSLLPEGAQPQRGENLRPLPFEELSARIRAHRPLLVSNENATMSLPGAQEKVGLRWDARRGALAECEGATLSTHILKPDSRQARYSPSAINEYACMKLAKALRLPVPDVWLLRVPEAAYVVERYDRVARGGHVEPLHQVDGCQLLGHGSGWKYQRQGGLASLAKLVAALRALPVRGADLLAFQRWVMFNYLAGNADAHAKNLSVLVDASGWRLAPFYDLVCVRAYGDEQLALFIGDEDRFDAVGAHSWEALCDDCGFRAPETLRGLRKLAGDFARAWPPVRARVEAEVHPTPAEADVLRRMDEVFARHTAHALSMTVGA